MHLPCLLTVKPELQQQFQATLHQYHEVWFRYVCVCVRVCACVCVRVSLMQSRSKGKIGALLPLPSYWFITSSRIRTHTHEHMKIHEHMKTHEIAHTHMSTHTHTHTSTHAHPPPPFFCARVQAVRRDQLLQLEFFSVHDYLHGVQRLCRALGAAGSRACLYFAAAVSDFYVPSAQMAEHKIQSRNGDLHLRLEPVPKLLHLVKPRLCPKAFVVSFKLETDAALLARKARAALAAYGHEMVVANMLHTRHSTVTVFTSSSDAVPGTTLQLTEGRDGQVDNEVAEEKESASGDGQVDKEKEKGDGDGDAPQTKRSKGGAGAGDLEELIIDFVASHHALHMSSAQSN